LEARSRAYTAPHHQVLRTRIVLLAADGMANVAIADLSAPPVTARSHSRWATNVDSRARAGALRPGLPAGTRGSAGPAGAGKHGGCANHEAEVVPVAVVVHVVDAHVVVEQ